LIQAYDARLRHLERKSMEAEMEAAKEEESEKDGRIQRQRARARSIYFGDHVLGLESAGFRRPHADDRLDARWQTHDLA